MITTGNKLSFQSFFCRVKASDLLLFGILLVGIIGATMAEQKVRTGGMGNVKSFLEPGVVSDEDRAQIEGFLDQVRGDAEAKAGRKFAALKPLEYATQLVNGINYFIKASTGDGKFVFLRLYKPFTGEVSFVNIQDDKAETDPLKYF